MEKPGVLLGQLWRRSWPLILLKSTGGSRGLFLWAFPASIELTCRADGPWHISQLIPGSRKARLSGSKPPPLVLRNWLV